MEDPNHNNGVWGRTVYVSLGSYDVVLPVVLAAVYLRSHKVQDQGVSQKHGQSAQKYSENRLERSQASPP